jgi:glycosyltransferase involved in cell wall biosynthesis
VTAAVEAAPLDPSVQPVRDEPLRILAVTNMWPEGQSFRGLFVEQLVEATRRLGHRVDVEIVAQSRGRLDHFLAAPRVRSRAAAGGYDVVHIHYGMTAPAARFVGSVPRVISLYGSDINVRWRRWMTRAGWGGCAARVYVSRRLAARANDPDPIIIPNGVDFGLFVPGDRQAARLALGASPDERLVLFGGHPGTAVKGWDVFSDVVARLGARGLPVRPVILSEPGQPAARVVEKFDAADLLLFTSRRGSEGSPTVVKEAIAMGLPVVSVDVGDVPDLLSGVVPSAVVTFPDDPDPAKARAALVDRLEERAASILALETRADGRDQTAWLDLDAVAGRVVDVYRSVIRS